MITVGMNYHVIEGQQMAFESAFNKVLAALQAAPGHDSSHLYRDVNDSQSYCIMSQWNDESAFTAFLHSAEFRAVADWSKEQILDRRPQHHIYGR